MVNANDQLEAPAAGQKMTADIMLLLPVSPLL